MSDKIVLNNYSDDAKIKQYVSEVLMPKVFHDIPLNVLNTGAFSILNEYMSQCIEQQSFTSAFYFNEAFISKAILADSIYAEAAIFNKGYSFATPSCCNFLLELKIEDLYNNSTLNADTNLYEFRLDKNTKFNMDNGSLYSLDYDILIQYKNIEQSGTIAWNIQYIMDDNNQNSISVNKNTYILYRVADPWLCMYITASEITRQTITVVNNMTNGVPNMDKVVVCDNHIASFDVAYIDENGDKHYLDKDHILTIHSTVSDDQPYIHYIMDNPQTIRFMFQLNGNKYFVPKLNTSYEITIYTCHGKAANFDTYDNTTQPGVITSSDVYPNNTNVMKAAFVISSSVGGTDIGNIESVRRDTIEAYNTVNVISTDHDIDEWFKSFFFKNVLYPFFFKRRDDPWGRIWSGYLALTDSDDYVFKTNTLHANIPYEVLYNNNENTVTSNEIIIPPGWIWVYSDANRYTVIPYTQGDGVSIETAKTLANISNQFTFSNPFGIRIQKEPFAIGYFNPWINKNATTVKLDTEIFNMTNNINDSSVIYHATPVTTNIVRTYRDDYYHITSYISPTISNWSDGSNLISCVQKNVTAPTFSTIMWNYFKEPLDLFTSDIPILPRIVGEGYLPFNPETTYFCVRNRNRVGDDKWCLSDIWIDDYSSGENTRVFIPITGDISMFYGKDKVWGESGYWVGNEVYVSSDTSISIFPLLEESSLLVFDKVEGQNYSELRLSSNAKTGDIIKIVTGEAVKTELTKYGETNLTKIGRSYAQTTYINVYYANGLTKQYTINNAANIYCPYDFTVDQYGQCEFAISEVGKGGILLYADMKPSPDSGAIDYYRIPLSSLSKDEALFYIKNQLLHLSDNNMRVVLHASINGSESGWVEMKPYAIEADGSYRFEADMHPLNQLVDIDNRINIASVEYGGGSWTPTAVGSVINVDATNPELKISIFIRSDDPMRDSDLVIGDSFTGFRLVDQYMLEDLSLVEELKEMRSVVNFGDTSIPTVEQLTLYKNYMNLDVYDNTVNGNIFTIERYAYNHVNSIQISSITFTQLKAIATTMLDVFKSYCSEYKKEVSSALPTSFDDITSMLTIISTSTSNTGNELDWNALYRILSSYKVSINSAFDTINIHGGLEVQLVPFVEYTTMSSERFPSFISSFTKIHETLEPVILNRLEGNNYLDCKLIATYGLPHSYASDTCVDVDNVYWPDLNVQLEFDVKLCNNSLSFNTINDLRTMIKSYFNRLTSIHTPVDLISMDNNIYISNIIKQMENHVNVSYIKFIGWYTNDKNKPDGNYMDANVQAIVQKWKTLEEFPKQELERFVPEMFMLEDSNIVLNII